MRLNSEMKTWRMKMDDDTILTNMRLWMLKVGNTEGQCKSDLEILILTERLNGDTQY